MPSAAEVVANCVEHDYNRTFHDTAVCILGDLKRAGYAVVELPDPMADRSNVVESVRPMPMWEVDGSWTCRTADDCIEFEAAHQTEYGTVTVSEARSLAAALLAAANAAEASE